MMMTIGAFAQQDRTITITSGGIERNFLLHLPSEMPAANLPVILAYHGMWSSPEELQYVSDFNALADEYGFIVLYPRSLMIGDNLQWNVYIDDQPGHGGVPEPHVAPDDVQFTRDMIAYLSDNFSIDRSRVFAAGFSNGGNMTYALSMLASDAIAAIAPVAGNLWTTEDGEYLNQRILSGSVRPMPVLHIHGTADDIVPYPDPDNRPGDYGEWPLWRAAHSCEALTYSQVIPIMDGVDKRVFCSAPVEVSLVRIEGMGHDWTNGTYQTSREIVKFFGLDKSTVASTGGTVARRFSVAPNPASTTLRIELPEAATVQLVSTLGEIDYSAEHAAGMVTLPCADLPNGIYNVRIVTRREVMTERVVVVR
jgi:polyhydroxybutyrate depolymerase